MRAQGTSKPTGQIRSQVTRNLGDLKSGPVVKVGLLYHLKNWLEHRHRELPGAPVRYLGRLPGVVVCTSELQGWVHRPGRALNIFEWELLQKMIQGAEDVRRFPAFLGGQTFAYGTLSRRVVTTTGVNFMVDAFQNLVELENMKFHGYGTGGAAEAIGNTALTTEETTQYVTDNTRPTGSQGEGASANIYRTTGTYSPDSGGTRAITEHGLFDQAATGGGVMIDRSLFSVINLVAGADSLQTQYDLTIAAGG